jgi:hypothetical protein
MHQYLKLILFAWDHSFLKISWLGALIGAAGGILSQRSANKTNVSLANTSYSRQAADLENAGLNRILGYAKGLPVQNPTIQPIFRPDMITSGMQAKLAGAQAETEKEKAYLTKRQAHRVVNEIDKLISEVHLNRNKAALVHKQTLLAIRQRGLIIEKTGTEEANKWFKQQLIDQIKKIAPEADEQSIIGTAMRILLIMKGER